MAHDPITYAKYGVTPHWQRIAVFDTATGKKILRVIEADAAEGWIVQMVVGPDGKTVRDGKGGRITQRVQRDITLLRTFGCGAPIHPLPHWPPYSAASIDGRADG